MQSLTPWRIARRGLWGYRGAHAAVACGVAVAAAVLVGALVVGDSVRGSLRDLTLERLGRIDLAIAPGRPFREELADELATANPGSETAPLLIAPASLSHREEGVTRRAGRATLIGCDERFWRLGWAGEAAPSFDGGFFLTRELAVELNVQAGDSILLRSTAVSALPADSPLGEKGDTVSSRRVRVARVLDPRGLARFGLAPSQGEPRNVFAPLALAQRLVDTPGEINTVVIAPSEASAPIEVAPRLADYGLTLDEVRPGMWQLESRELVLPDAVVAAAERAWNGLPLTAAATYLANTLRVGDRSIPYSTVTGLGALPFPVVDADRSLNDNQIVLNRWAADDLGAEIGDELTLTYYEPESTHGVLREAAPVTLRVAGVAEMQDADGGPSTAADRRWTPRLEGVTDARTISDWDLPFELVEPIRQTDEAYWDEHGTTPKAFVSFALAERLWASRWGTTSLIRVEAPEATREGLVSRLLSELRPADFGLDVQPIKQQGLAASSGSTPFDVLFLLFSLFLIGSALLLIALLTWLAIDARRGEVGLLGAVGYDRSGVRRWLLKELAPVAAIGSVGGALVGVAYAAGLLALLRTVWLAAVGSPFLRLHADPAVVVGGALAAWLVAVATIALAVRRATRTPPRRLLAGGADDTEAASRSDRYSTGIAAGCATLAGIAILSGGTQSGEAAAGAFFGGGALVLIASIALLYKLSHSADEKAAGALSLGRLATLNVRRRAGRAMLTIGLLGAACFLLLATSAFRLPPTEAGTGGFDLVAESSQPIHYDLATAAGRQELGFSEEADEAFDGTRIYGFRVQPGEDASCRNLYQTSQPRVLGVTEAFASDGTPRFSWAAIDNNHAQNPWQAIESPTASGEDDAIPVVLDFNTAMYSLKLYGGVGARFEIRDEAGRPVKLRVAGLLKNSVLQGDLLMSEANFLRLFPSAGGYGFFLIDSARGSGSLAPVLEESLSDYGFDAEPAAARLARFLAVQNTYLSTFQALGVLGLMLGAVGLAVAQFRNLLERRGELALMRASGFGRGRLRRLVLNENLALLACGLLVGTVAALATLLPLAAVNDARPPWSMAIALVAATLGIGLLAARLATDRVLRAPLTAALRGE